MDGIVENVKMADHPSLNLTKSWKCTDRVHPSPESQIVAVQMIVNALCNGDMDEDSVHEDYCCARERAV